MKLLLPEQDAYSISPSLIGGKAAALARLSMAGFPVPSWAVLPASAWSQFSASLRLPDFSGLADGSVSAECDRIKQMILEQAWPREITDALRTWTDQHPGYYAVRSSVSGEDSEKHSFAGQMESFLFQKGNNQVERSIKQCWASAFSERAILYRRQNHLDGAVMPSVIIQEMIESEVSGVLFTVHPLTADRGTMLLSAAPGLGEGIVSGLVNTDEFTIDRSGHVEIETAIKDVKIVLDESGTGTQQVMVNPEVAAQPCLTDKQARRIAELGRQIADHFGKPMDIEWALRQDVIYILQARPITRMPLVPFGHRQVWDNSNIQESFCGVTTPMTFSFAQMAYATVYEQTMRLVRLPEQVIQSHRDMLRSLLGLIRGRVYYNINNWYRGLLLLPSFKTNKADMERMMGLTEPVDFIVDRPVEGWARVVMTARMIRTALRLLFEFSRIEKSVAAFHESFRTHAQHVRNQRLQELTLEELFELIDYLRDKILMRWHPPIINDFYVMMFSGKVRRWLDGLKEPDVVMNGLLSGEPELASTKPTKELVRLSEIARRDPALQNVLVTQEPARILDVVRWSHPVFYEECVRFIDSFGDRVMGELKLETTTLRQDSSFMFVIMKNYLGGSGWNQEREQGLRREAETIAEIHVRTKHGWWKLHRFRADLRRYRTGVRQRESTRLERTRLFGMVRTIVLEIGEQLSLTRLIAEPRDVFYLTLDELENWMHGRLVQTKIGEMISLRKAEFAEYEKEELPNRIETVGPVYHFNPLASATPAPSGGGDHWTGLGCYPGTVEGEVRRIMNPAEAVDLNGHILVTLRTDPGWTPLFPSCRGVIVERGSSLSHSAVIARELAIPTIVAVTGISKILNTGDRIRMDGSTGEIWRL